MSERLAGKVALITGASSGIGAACVEHFRREGAVVAGLDLHASSEADVALVADVTDEAAVDEAVRSVVAAHGRIDVLVYAVGVTGGGPVHLIARSEWDRVIGINLTGTMLVSKHVIAAAMLPQRYGSVIHLASVEGLEGMDLISVYNASKGGVVLLTRQMAVDYGRVGIRVNCLCPGFIDTPMTALFRAEGAEDIRGAVADVYLLGRFGRPDEVSAAALFLASDDASFITGHALAVDGGLTAGHRFGLGAALGL